MAARCQPLSTFKSKSIPMQQVFRFRGAVSFCLLAATCTSTHAIDQPNILLFTADDLHAESLGVYGGLPADLTPHLNAFAAEGMRFNMAHVNAAICAPCRAIIATGRYSHRSGAMGFMPAREDVPDIVTTFRRGGYLTGILGKVGHSTPKSSMKWDYQYDQKDLGNGRNPELYFQRSKTFLERCRAEGKPFYFMVNSHDPHRPYCNPDKLTRGAAMPSKVYSAEDVDVPGFLPDLPGVKSELAMYLNSTRRLDDTFGKVMQALQESGMSDNTLVVFMSDNGIAVPFAKCNTWFHSSRTPLLVRWPGNVAPGSLNNTNFVSTVDLFPTFLEVSGVAGPNGLDGRSFCSLLQGKTQPGRDFVYTQIDSKAGGDAVPMRAVQNAEFGYIYNPFSDGKHVYRNNNEGQSMAAMQSASKNDPAIAARIAMFRYRVAEEFYDLKADPNCLNNLIDSADHAAIIKTLQDKLVIQMQATGDPMLPAFQHRTNRKTVDKILAETYGAPAQPKDRRNRPKAKQYH